jgi:hypothetical protein
MSSLPPDFNETLEKIEEFGILTEPPEVIHIRLKEAVSQTALSVGQNPMDAGPFTDWVTTVLDKFTKALHQELCDPRLNGLKSEYSDLIAKGLSTDGIVTLSGIVTPILAAIAPIYAVSSVTIYLSVFMLKVGLNAWCRSPIQSD